MNNAVVANRIGTRGKPTNLLEWLQNIKIGGDPSKAFKKKDMILMLRNLTTLVDNGVPLPQAITTVAADKSLAKYRKILQTVSEAVKTGTPLSRAMKEFPEAFNEMLINQVKVGERSGTLTDTLVRVTEQIEQGASLKRSIIKKLTYPTILVLAGIGSVTFMVLCVIPTFQNMYEESGATLPAITQLLIDIGEIVQNHLVMMLSGVSIALFSVGVAFHNNKSRRIIDRGLIRLPVLGDWFRNIAILQFMEVLGNLMESGFTLAEALQPAGRAVSNHYIRGKVNGLYAAVRRGERFSRVLEQEGDLFPPVVKQLVIVGERTGKLTSVTRQIRDHLRRDVDNYTNTMVGGIEPILTAGLALVVGGILLAVYLPMFDMIGKTN